jgi:hypothetical protein
MNRKWIAALLACSTALALAARADESAAAKPPGKFFVGVEAGQTTSNVAVAGIFTGPDIDSRNGRSTGYKIRIGYQFIRYVAVEVGYLDFGSVDIKDAEYTCASSQPPPCTYNINSKLHGALVSAVGTLPMGKHWELSARVGWLRASGVTTIEDPDLPSSRQRLSDGNIGINTGIGLRYKITDQLDAELNWERSDQLGFGLDLGGGAGVFNFGTAKLASLGMRYRF